MANRCITNYRFHGTHENLLKFQADLDKLTESNRHGWTLCDCNVMAEELLGLTKEQQSKMHLRGFMCDSYANAEDDDYIAFYIDSAWNPCNELMDMIAEKYDLEIYWLADERGCCGIWSNDTEHHVWDWKYVAYNHQYGDEENFCDEEELIEWANRFLKGNDGKPVSTIEELMELDDFSITEVEYSDNF